MDGHDAHVDQCMFGLKLPNDSNQMLPVQKPTTFRTTCASLSKRISKKCDGTHAHTHLEGSIPGVGLRSWLAESYPQALASHFVNAIIAELESGDVFAVEDMPSAQQEIADYIAGRRSGVQQVVGGGVSAGGGDQRSSCT